MTVEAADTDGSGKSGNDLVNDQIRDSVAQVQQLLDGMQRPFAAATTFNIVAHALSLALQNAVTRQQHSQMLRNALRRPLRTPCWRAVWTKPTRC